MIGICDACGREMQIAHVVQTSNLAGICLCAGCLKPDPKINKRELNMGTKSTISHNQNYHLYEEVFDSDNIYLRMDTKDWSYDGRGVTIQIPIEEWRKMAEDWKNSYWALHPDKDHYRMTDEDFERGLQALEELVSKKEDS